MAHKSTRNFYIPSRKGEKFGMKIVVQQLKFDLGHFFYSFLYFIYTHLHMITKYVNRIFYFKCLKYY